MHADRRQRVAARARVGPEQDAVAEVVAQERLHAVGEIAYQHGVRELAWRGGPVVGVDRFEHGPVAVDVIPAVSATVAEVGALGRAVHRADGGAEDTGNPVGVIRGHRLAGRLDQHRVDTQAAGFLLGGEQHDRAGVADHEGGAVVVELGHQLLHRCVHRERPQQLAAPPARSERTGVRGEADVVPTGGHELGEASALCGCPEEAGRAQKRGERAGGERGAHVHVPVVEDEEAPSAAGSRGGGHHVLAEETLSDAVGVVAEGAHFLVGDGTVGHPVVEVPHQPLLVGDRQQRRVLHPLGQAAVETAVVRGGGPGMGDHVGQPVALAPRDGGYALLAGPADVPSKPRHALGHRAVLLRSTGADDSPTCPRTARK